MKRHVRHILSVAACSLLACGCGTVSVMRPLEEKVDAREKARFEGAWSGYGAIIFVHVPEKGLPQVATLQWSGDRFRVRQGRMSITIGQSHRFVCVSPEEGKEKGAGWLLLQYRFASDGDLVIWLPNAEAIERAVRDANIEGEIRASKHSTDVVITSPPEKLLEFLDGKANFALFHYETPVVLRKVDIGKELWNGNTPEQEKP